MKTVWTVFLILNVLALPALTGDYAHREKSDIQKILQFKSSGKAGKIEVDNLNGRIHIKGARTDTVTASIAKEIRAKTADDVLLAKEEVTLDISQDDNLIRFYVDGPFRDRQWQARRDYQVIYDFQIEIPQNTEIFLKTVNHGDVNVENVAADFSIKNVNGKIIIDHIKGSGSAQTVNGGIRVLFDSNPRADCYFRTINGDLELNFPQLPSADFWLKTFNGDIYSDFDVEYLSQPVKSIKSARKSGRYIYKSNHFQGIRVGRGGPEIKMDTLNGDLLIAKTK